MKTNTKTNTKSKLIVLACAVLAVILYVPLYPESGVPIKYFRLDSIVKVTGEITEIKNEECYKDEDFAVLYIMEQTSDRTYKVEVSPGWFFKMKIKKGKAIQVTGSYLMIGDDHVIMTQTIEYEGKIVNFRDNQGFPLWRGKGKMKGRSERRGPMRRRGRF